MGADAGVVIVAAAGNGRANLDSSNYASYGSRVDVQAWGDWTVMTSGYGECTGFSGSSTPGSRYTNTFAGTSSASAITAAGLTLFQSWALRELGAPLAPLVLRDILKSTGHPQRGSGGNIGPHTNLRAAAEAALGGPLPSPSPTPAPPTAAPTPPPPTAAPTPPPPTPAPAPTPPGGSACLMQRDCDINPWCTGELESWCATNGEGGSCPSPHCYWG